MTEAADNDFAPYQGRHGSGDDEPARRTPGPTSPVSGPAGQAAARAAYEDAPKGASSAQARSGAAGASGEPEPPAQPAAPAGAEGHADQADPSGQADQAGQEAAPAPEEPGTGLDDSPEALARAFQLETSARESELLDQLQRLNAEYTNYKRRVDRDRDVEKSRAVAGVMEALLPVLDEIHLARVHGELAGGPFAKIAEKLESILSRYGVERYGDTGEAFDPMVHQAITHTQAELPEGTTATTVIQVMQPGYRMGDKVLRPAFVAVADPL